MPQFQLLDQNPSFGNRLASQLGQSIGGGIQNSLAEFQKNKKLDQSALGLASLLEKTGLNVEKDALKNILSMGVEAKDILGFATDLSKIQETQNIRKEKEIADLKAKEEETKGLSNTLDWLDENVKYTGTKTIPGFKSFTAGGLNRKAVQKREEYDSSGFWAADNVFTHFNKGTVSKEKLATIKKDLAPNSKLSERQNKARINALRRMANLPSDISKEKFDKILDYEVNNIQKTEKKELDLNQFFK